MHAQVVGEKNPKCFTTKVPIVCAYMIEDKNTPKVFVRNN